MDAAAHWWARGKEFLGGNADQMQQIRQEMQRALPELQFISTATLVVSVVIDVFAFMAGGFFGTVILLASLIVTVLSYDTMVACKNALPISQNAKNFNVTGPFTNQVGVIQNIRRKWMPMFEGTLVLGGIAAFMLSQAELAAQHHQQF